MVFIDPSKEEIYQTLLNNDYLIEFLKKERVLVSKESLREDYTYEYVEEMTQTIIVNNISTLYSLAEVLFNFKEKINSKSMKELLNDFIAWDEIAEAIGIPSNKLTTDIYVNIIYTYKYCYSNSFFQNNRKLFLPDFDYNQLENNPAAMAFYDATLKEFDKLDYILEQCTHYMDIDSIPWDIIDYFSQILGFEKSRLGLGKDEKKTKEVIRNIIDIYRIKGTNYSFKLFFELLGYDIKISEYYFDRRLHYTNNSSNEETNELRRNNFQFYLTTKNPSDNKLENLSINEFVSTSDITEQYSLDEFNDLVSKYGIEPVLGYSKYYYNKNEKKYIKYTGKIYKYFKTNYIYYDVYLNNDIIPTDEYNSIIKILKFLTPSYVMRRSTSAKVKDYLDEIGFDGDGNKKYNSETDGYGQIEILDDEDWSQYLEEKLKGENYKNSLYDIDSEEGTKFRFPIKNRAMNVSLNKFYSAPAEHVKNYNTIKYFWDKNNKPNYSVAPNLDLREGNSESIKTQIKENRKKFTTYSDPREEYDYSLTGKGEPGFPSIKEILKERNIYQVINSGTSITEGGILPFNNYYYNNTEGQLYVGNINNKAIKAEDFFGRFEYKGEEARLYLYDKAWEGYDEESDKEEFLAYNHDHIINWPEMGFNYSRIGRPIKSKTDKELKTKKDDLMDYILSGTIYNFKNVELNGYDDKEYYIEIDNTYSSDSISPKEYSMYEKVGETYIETSDLTLLNNKTYYIKVIGKGLNNNSSKSIGDLYKNYTNEDQKSMLYNIYTINYFLKEKGGYYIDDYGHYYDVYSEALDISKLFFEEHKNDYLKNYYYNKLVSLYREKFISDNGVTEDILDTNPMFLTNRVLNTFAKNKNKFAFKSTLSSLYKYDNNGTQQAVKLKFKKIANKDNKLKVFTNHKFIVESLGYDIDKAFDVIANKKDIKDKILPLVKFRFESKDYKIFERTFVNGIIESFYSNGISLVSKNNKIQDSSGREIATENISEALQEVYNNGYVIITFNSDIKDTIEKDGFDMSDYTYMEINRLQQSFADNTISYPYSESEYLNKDIYGRVDEFISNGDDREFYYTIIDKGQKKIKCRAFLNENKKITLRIPKTCNLSMNQVMETDNVQITIS